MNAEPDLARTLEQISVRGNLADAQRIHGLADTYGNEVVPFLQRAAREGSPPVVAAAVQALARIDLDAAAERALALLEMPDQNPDARAAAAEVLSQVHSEDALTALIRATLDSPTVSGAAIRSLHEHRSTEATVRLRDHLRSIVDELGHPSPEGTANKDQQKLLARRARAVVGVDGSSGLLRLLAERCYPDLESDLLSWWRSHPDIVVKAAAAQELLDRGVDHACAMLTEGLPGANDGHPMEPNGELDNGYVRHILAEAVYIVLLGAPSDAFDRLYPYFGEDQLRGWFGAKRAEIILLLLLGQVGWNPTSWLWGYADNLCRRGARPDARWRGIGSRLLGDCQLLRGLSDELDAKLADSPM